MFFEAALKGKNQFWRYFIMFIAAFLAANIIGAIPLVVIIAVNTAKDPALLERSSDNFADLSVYGIEPITGFILVLIPFIVGLLTIALLTKPLNERGFKTIFNGSGSVRWSRFLIGMLVWSLFLVIYLVYTLKTDPDNYSINNNTYSLLILFVVALLLIPFQTIFEEVLFRGYLMQGMGVWFRNKWLPLVFTSLLFALMHSFNPEIKEFGFWTMMPQYLIYGTVFGFITVMDNGIEIAMGAHTVNNIFLSVLVTQESSALQTPAYYRQHEVYPWSDFMGLLLMSVVFIVVLWFIFKWDLRRVGWNRIEANMFDQK
ncbi:MAG TPA: CPBP family intramembrane glutamic endopeptidase [Bacteroidales bacterium]|nr:CPBP family intramembrane glutamic endopeptidase [Bacteroidales bacterium]